VHKWFSGVAAAACVIALSGTAFAKTETIKGQIVDSACYKMDKSNTGADHKMPKGDAKECAIQCAKNGNQMAILTSDGKLYELAGGLAANKNEKIVAHVGHTVEVTGDVMDHGGGHMMITADTLTMVSK
jgi:hypothetical protein